MSQPKNLNLPSRKSVDEAIAIFEGFRDLCCHQLEVGYWATVDFPSKHHLNRLLQLGWRNPKDLEYVYGEGLTRRILDLQPSCKAYAAFTRDPTAPPPEQQSRPDSKKPRPQEKNGQEVEG